MNEFKVWSLQTRVGHRRDDWHGLCLEIEELHDAEDDDQRYEKCKPRFTDTFELIPWDAPRHDRGHQRRDQVLNARLGQLERGLRQQEADRSAEYLLLVEKFFKAEEEFVLRDKRHIVDV